MKKIMVMTLVIFTFGKGWAQEFEARVAEVHFATVSQDGIEVSGSFGESIVGSDTQEGIIIVHGYYSGIMADTATGINELNPIPGLQIYPNPASDGVILTVDIVATSDYRVGLITETGIPVQHWIWPMNTKQMTLDLRLYPSGKFLINVEDLQSGKRSIMVLVMQ